MNSVAGGTHSKGYIVIKCNGGRFYAHRLAWFYVHGVWPVAEIDHKDHNPKNNAIKNLRAATRQQNLVNSRDIIRAESGVRGVRRVGNRWSATIGLNYKRVYLGTFGDQREAGMAYDRAAIAAFGEFARLNYGRNHNSRLGV